MDPFWAVVLILVAFGVGFVMGRQGLAPKPLPPLATPDAAALEAVRPILAADGKIPAIRAYREKTGTGLRDARFAVETLESETVES